MHMAGMVHKGTVLPCLPIHSHHDAHGSTTGTFSHRPQQHNCQVSYVYTSATAHATGWQACVGKQRCWTPCHDSSACCATLIPTQLPCGNTLYCQYTGGGDLGFVLPLGEHIRTPAGSSSSHTSHRCAQRVTTVHGWRGVDHGHHRCLRHLLRTRIRRSC